MSPALLGLALALPAAGGGWQEGPPLPRPVSNNAVVAVETARGSSVFSFMGLTGGREWDDVVSWTFRWDVGSEAWTEGAPVPGPGRLASTAEAVDGRIYVFGGYTVAEDGSERSVPDVNVYDPEADAWSRAADIPVPVDDAVSGVWRDSLVYLVSGWHDRGNEVFVQVYDPDADRWAQATPIEGMPVFGHAGAVTRDAIVYVDGVRSRPRGEVSAGGSRFVLEAAAWRGDIHPDDPTLVTWRRLPDHPGPPLYRAAAVAVGTRVLFVGGTDNPYNYDGIGYDGRASQPVASTLAYDLVTGSWSSLSAPWTPTMDHRAAVRAGGYVILVGGMEAGQQVSRRVQMIPVVDLVTGG